MRLNLTPAPEERHGFVWWCAVPSLRDCAKFWMSPSAGAPGYDLAALRATFWHHPGLRSAGCPHCAQSVAPGGRGWPLMHREPLASGLTAEYRIAKDAA